VTVVFVFLLGLVEIELLIRQDSRLKTRVRMATHVRRDMSRLVLIIVKGQTSRVLYRTHWLLPANTRMIVVRTKEVDKTAAYFILLLKISIVDKRADIHLRMYQRKYSIDEHV
jgi:hypothetical protein